MPEPPFQIAGQSKKMAVEQLSFEQCKIILKWYWKFENVCKVQKRWQCEFAMEHPTRLTFACIHDKFEADDMVHDVHKQRSGRSCTATSPASSAVVLEQFMITAKVRKTMCTMGVSHFTFNKMAHHH
jgi:hypothetical protein